MNANVILVFKLTCHSGLSPLSNSSGFYSAILHVFHTYMLLCLPVIYYVICRSKAHQSLYFYVVKLTPNKVYLIYLILPIIILPGGLCFVLNFQCSMAEGILHFLAVE